MNRRFRYVILILILALSCTMISFAVEPDTSVEGATLPLTLEIHKVDSGTELPISGAEFILYKEDGYFLATAPTDSKALWSDKESDAYRLVADSDGVITLTGLMPGTYYLQETAAPEGYLRLEETLEILLSAKYDTDAQGDPVIVSASAQINGTGPISSSADAPDCVVVIVPNDYDTALPETGGLGTSLFYISGFVILFVFSLIVATKRLAPKEE